MRKRSKISICGKYKATTSSVYCEAFVTNLQSRIEYKGKIVEKDGDFFSKPHMMLGYSGVGTKKNRFTLRFADCVDGGKIVPFEGNTVTQSYEAEFRM